MNRRDGVSALVNPGAVAAAYGTGDMIGTLQKISDVAMDSKGLAVLRTVLVLDKDNQKAAIDILLFNAEPTLALDNAAFTISDLDLEKLICRISVLGADYTTLEAAGNAEATKNLEVLLPTVATKKDIWMAVVSRGTPTYTNNGLKIRMIMERY